MTSTVPNPLALIAELTHRCPLHCVYCSNPLEMQARANELSTETWSRVFREAAEAGVLQADFTGGEPLARTDIVDLIRAARAVGLYVNLITSGLPMDEAKLAALVEAGLDHMQLSFQGSRSRSPPAPRASSLPTSSITAGPSPIAKTFCLLASR